MGKKSPVEFDGLLSGSGINPSLSGLIKSHCIPIDIHHYPMNIRIIHWLPESKQYYSKMQFLWYLYLHARCLKWPQVMIPSYWSWGKKIPTAGPKFSLLRSMATDLCWNEIVVIVICRTYGGFLKWNLPQASIGWLKKSRNIRKNMDETWWYQHFRNQPLILWPNR